MLSSICNAICSMRTDISRGRSLLLVGGVAADAVVIWLWQLLQEQFLSFLGATVSSNHKASLLLLIESLLLLLSSVALVVAPPLLGLPPFTVSFFSTVQEA